MESDSLTAYRITFDDGDTIETSMAAGVTLDMARQYYIGNVFETADESRTRRAVAVSMIRGPSRKLYVAGGISHQDYYVSVAQAAGIAVPDTVMDAVRKSTDEHYNDIPLRIWDQLAISEKRPLARSLVMHGDAGWTLGCGVCAFKAIAKHLAGMNSVTRYVVTFLNRDGMRTLAHNRQGRCTYETEAEAQAWIDAARVNSPSQVRDLFGDPDTLEVRPCPCYPGHFDPQTCWFD